MSSPWAVTPSKSVDGVLYVNGAVVDEPYVVNKDVVKGQAQIRHPRGLHLRHG